MKKGYISKAELAMAYRPDVSLKVALRTLSNQLEETPGLMDALLKTGYRKTRKIFTPYQIEIIYQHIGAP